MLAKLLIALLFATSVFASYTIQDVSLNGLCTTDACGFKNQRVKFCGDIQITQLVFTGTPHAVATITGNIVKGSCNNLDGATAVTLPGVNVPLSFAGQKRATSCDILNLDLGPIFLNLLGLQLTTNEIQLDLTAVPGAGNLLGNLLCAVVNILNPSGIGAGILSNLLNAIQTAISGILAGL